MKKLYFLYISLLIINFTNAQWVQIGQDIDGEIANEYSGNSVSLNSDGSIVAIGAYRNSETATEAGQTRIYQDIAGNWVQIGNDINGDNINDKFGTSVCIDSTGKIIAIGASRIYSSGGNYSYVKVFEYNGTSWNQIGGTILAEDTLDLTGYSVAINSNGTILIIGEPGNDDNGNDAGQVRIFQNIANNWVQIGNDINGEAIDDNFGYSVSINSDGSIIAIGAYYNDGTGLNAGHVRVYKNISGNWTQLGNDIDGESAGDRSGKSVSLNSAGNIVAIGSPTNMGSNYYSGQVRIYEFNTGNWIQLGNDIEGSYDHEALGSSVSLNSSGLIVAVGSPQHSELANEIGRARVFEYISGVWTQIDNYLDGEDHNNWFGFTVSISDIGSKVAVGSLGNDGNGINAGHVRVFGNDNVIVEEIGSKLEFSIYPNPTTGLITIKNEKLRINSIEVFDLYGNEVRSQKSEVGSRETEVDLSNQAKGIYVIKVQTDRGVVVEKVVLE